MKEIVTKEEFNLQKDAFFKDIEEGAIFIHPTDTIYGIGGNATSPSVVREIREIKKRGQQPFSVIAPSQEWIRKNCIITPEAEQWLNKLPGPYTLILRLKNKDCIAENVAPGLSTLGLRIPNHWFSKVIRELEIPIITTSANAKDEAFMTCLEDLNPEIRKEMDFIIYEGEKKGKPSEVVDLTGEVKITKR